MGRCARRPKRRPVRGRLKRPRRSIYQAVRGVRSGGGSVGIKLNNKTMAVILKKLNIGCF